MPTAPFIFDLSVHALVPTDGDASQPIKKKHCHVTNPANSKVRTQQEAAGADEVEVQAVPATPETTEPAVPDASAKPAANGKAPRVKGGAVGGNRTKTGGAGGRKGGKGRGRMRGRPRTTPLNGTAHAGRKNPKATKATPDETPPSAMMPQEMMGPDGQPMAGKNISVVVVETSGGIVRRKKKGRKGGKGTTAAPALAA